MKSEITIEILLILLLVFTPIAFGSQVIWAFSLMELGILLIIILGTVQVISNRSSTSISKSDIRHPTSGMPSSGLPNAKSDIRHPTSEMVLSEIRNPKSAMFSSQIRNSKSEISLSILLLSLFLAIVLLQMIPLPAGIVKIISPKTYELRNQLTVISSVTDNQSAIRNPKSKMLLSSNLNPQSEMVSPEIRNPKSEMSSSQIRNPQSAMPSSPGSKSQIRNPKSEIVSSSNLNPQSWFPLTFFPLSTKIRFFKWLALAGLFIFLLHWKLSDNRYRITNHLIIAIFLVGVFESLYGMFEFFSGRRHIFYVDWSDWVNSVTGTFLNRNCFAGYLLMVIPLSIGFFLSRETYRYGQFMGWRHRLSSLDGKTLLLGFGLILMILALILSASRGGIISLLISFSLMIFLFRNPSGRERFSKIFVPIFCLAVLWVTWIGLDAVISRFFTASEDFAKSRWLLWVGAYGILKDFPFLGSGLGTFPEVYSIYRSSHILGLDIQAENDFLQLAAEVGVVGIVPLLALFVFLFFKATSGIRSLSPEEPQRYIGIGGLVGILALMFHSIVQKNLQLPANAFLYTVIWAMVLRISTDSSGKGTPREQARGE